MAELSLRPLEPLIIDTTSTSMNTTWEHWLDQLEMYFLAANIADAKRQKALLLYCGGSDLQKLYQTLDDQEETFDAAKTKLNTYFKPKSNVTFERNKFYSCAQAEGETVSSYITKLKDRARTC